MGEIKWGIIGCGDVNEVKSGPAFNKVEDSQLYAVMRRNGEKAEDYAKRHKVPNWSNDSNDLFDNSEIDAIYVSTPPVFHLSYALKSLTANKHVYVEKPMVLNTEEAIQLRDAAIISDKKVVVAHYRRCLPMFLKIKEIIDTKSIGTIEQISLQFSQSMRTDVIAKSEKNWRINSAFSGGGLFFDIAPHQIDLICYFFGTPLNFNGVADHQENNDIPNTKVDGEILFENNVRFNGSWNFSELDENSIDQCFIIGSKGQVSFSFFGNEVNLENDEGVKFYSFEHPKHVQQPMIEKTVNYFLGKGENPCSVEEGLVVSKIMDAFTKTSLN